MITWVRGGRAELERIDAHVRAVLDRHADWLGHRERYELRLGLHELLVNIVEHAYGPGNGPIEVVFSSCATAVRAQVTDWGRRFDGPPAPDLPREPAAGGYGLPILHAVYDDVSYTRHGAENRWALVSTRPNAPPAR